MRQAVHVSAVPFQAAAHSSTPPPAAITDVVPHACYCSWPYSWRAWSLYCACCGRLNRLQHWMKTVAALRAKHTDSLPLQVQHARLAAPCHGGRPAQAYGCICGCSCTAILPALSHAPPLLLLLLLLLCCRCCICRRCWRRTLTTCLASTQPPAAAMQRHSCELTQAHGHGLTHARSCSLQNRLAVLLHHAQAELPVAAARCVLNAMCLSLAGSCRTSRCCCCAWEQPRWTRPSQAPAGTATAACCVDLQRCTRMRDTGAQTQVRCESVRPPRPQGLLACCQARLRMCAAVPACKHAL